MSNICKECGAAIPAGSVKCPECGEPVPASAASPSRLPAGVSSPSVSSGASAFPAPQSAGGNGKKVFASQVSETNTTDNSSHVQTTDNSTHYSETTTIINQGKDEPEYCGVCGSALEKNHAKCPKCGKKICPSCKAGGKNRCVDCDRKAKDEYRLEFRGMLLEMGGKLNAFGRRVMDEKARSLDITPDEKKEIENEFSSLMSVSGAGVQENVKSGLVAGSSTGRVPVAAGSIVVPAAVGKGLGSLAGGTNCAYVPQGVETAPQKPPAATLAGTQSSAGASAETGSEGACSQTPSGSGGGLGKVIVGLVVLAAIAGGIFFALTPSSGDEEIKTKRYVLERGDTAMKICAKSGATMDELRALNPNVDFSPTKLKIGQVIIVPDVKDQVVASSPNKIPETFRANGFFADVPADVKSFAQEKMPAEFAELEKLDAKALKTDRALLDRAREVGKGFREDSAFVAGMRELEDTERAAASTLEKISDAQKRWASRKAVPATFRTGTAFTQFPASEISSWAQKRKAADYQRLTELEAEARTADESLHALASRLEADSATWGTFSENADFTAEKSKLEKLEAEAETIKAGISQAYENRPRTKPYAMARGDTPTKICEKHGITMAELQDLNPGVEFSVLKMKVGQVINVPATDEE